jgi:acyl carrier protein
VKVNWSEFASFDSRHYIQLPTYAWQRKRYWVEAGEKPEPIAQTAIAHLLNQTNLEQIVRQLKTTANLSEDESQLLNKLMQRLIQNSDRQSTAASSSMSQAEPQLNKTSVTVTDIETWMINKIAKELGIQPEDVDKQASFDSYGLDSVLAINIASAGKQYLGIEVSPLMLMHYPTIASLSQHLAAEMASSDTELFEI